MGKCNFCVHVDFTLRQIAKLYNQVTGKNINIVNK